MDTRMLAKLALVLAAVLPLVVSTCNYSVDPAQIRNMLYQQMETALLKDSENLYRLRQAFFPNTQAEPTVLRVTFGLRLNNVSSELCGGAVESNLGSLQLSQRFFWTSSAIYSALNPRIMDLLLPETLYLLKPLTNSYYDFTVTDLTLFLDIDSLPCLPSSCQIADALMDLTTQLKAYANEQGRLDSWNSENRGYSTEQRASELAIVFFYVPTLLLLAAVVLIVFKGVTINKFKDFLRKKVINEETQERPFYILFVTTYIMVAIINYIFFIMELIGILLWSHSGDPVGVGITVSKVIHILISCILPGIVAVFVARSVAGNRVSTDSEALFDSNRMPKVPNGLKHAVCIFTCGFGWCISGCHCLVQETLVAMNFLVFVATLAWCVIPTVVLAFADPVGTIAVASLTVSLFLFTAIAMSAVILLAEEQMSRDKGFKASTILVGLIVILVGGVVVSLIALYLYIIEKGASTGGLTGAITAFIPTAITGVAVWLVKRALQSYVPNTQETNTERSTKGD